MRSHQRTSILPYVLRRGLLVLVGALGVASCRQEARDPGDVGPEVIRARDLAAEYMLQDRAGEARKALAPLLEGGSPHAEDLLRAALIELKEEKPEAARPYVDAAAKRVPDDPVLAWARYRLARIAFDNEEALRLLEPLAAARPDDFPVQLAYTLALDDLDRPETEAQAERRFRELLEVPPELAESWRIVVLERLRQMLMFLDRRDEALAMVEEIERLRDQGLTSPGEPKHQAGTLGEVRPHTHRAFGIEPPTAPALTHEAHELATELTPTGFAVARAGRGTRGADLGHEAGMTREELFAWTPDPLLVVAHGERGIALLERGPDGAWTRREIWDEPTSAVLPFDRMDVGAKPTDLQDDVEPGDQELDLLVSSEKAGVWRTVLLENVASASGPDELRGRAHELFGGSQVRPGGYVPVDHDHDGDLDLLIDSGGANRLFRNDGVDADPRRFTDVTTEIPFTACPLRTVPEDLDRDNDVDFLAFDLDGTAKLAFLSSQRAGRFRLADDQLPDERSGAWFVAADLDGDSWVDLAFFDDQHVRVHRRSALGTWVPEVLRWPLSEAPTGQPVVTDLDLDGTSDLVWPTAGHPAVALLAPGFANGGVDLPLGPAFAAPRPDPAQLAVADLDGDGDHDLLRCDVEGLVAHLLEGHGKGHLLELMGHKDVAHGEGAIVELRKDRRYRRIYWRGAPELVAFDGAAPDLVRITWPNGVVQNFLDPPAENLLFWQRRGLVGSCPFLYTWNGETFEFISDVLGITPLGLPMAPGQLVPPDHDEYVLVRGDQLVPRDGVYELQLTEELREVTYLDRLRLDVVDHPADVEVFPEERFSFPPFPPPHTHTLRDPLSPLSAVGSDGRDWTAELARDDRDLAHPFVTHADQFRGLARPWFVELAFDPARVRAADKLRLALNGWLVWTDASVNVAAARHPEMAFVPPILQVPDGTGGWRDAGPPLGFPAGKLKTMVVDVTELIDRDDPRIRIFSTLVLYWDSIRLATDADDAPLVVTRLEPLSAELWERGFSLPVAFEDDHPDLEWFDWDRLSPEPRWDQHPGHYTRYGDTLELVTAIDDRFVVMGAGDALTVRFDATGLPPLSPGWTRDYLVFLDGWAKDRDPNTLEALHVEPLPFHGMSGYPYGPDEAFPDTELHRAWRRDWQTRPARRWIDPVTPPRPPARAASRTAAAEAGFGR